MLAHNNAYSSFRMNVKRLSLTYAKKYLVCLFLLGSLRDALPKNNFVASNGIFFLLFMSAY